MGLNCSCSDGDGVITPGAIVWYEPDCHSVLDGTRASRCVSCGDRIPLGAIVAKFERFKVPQTEIEIKIYGESGLVPRAPWYHCERCADLYFSLEELGFCLNPLDDQRELVKEYAEVYGSREAEA